MTGVESYNPERSPDLSGRSRREQPIMTEGTPGSGTEGGAAGQPPAEPAFIVGQEIEVPPQPAPARQPTRIAKFRAGMRALRREFWGERPQRPATSPQPAPQAARPPEQPPSQPAAEQPPQPAVPEIPPPAPPGGEGPPPGQAPEGPRAPENPLPPDYLWSAEFRAERFSVVKELSTLEGLHYKILYGNAQNRQLLQQLYKRWKELEALDTLKSQESKPFNPADLEQPTQAKARRSYDNQYLETIPKINNQDPTAELWSKNYTDLRQSPIPQDQLQAEARERDIDNARGYLSRYFKEAHRIGILDAVDDELNSIAKEIQHGLDQGLSPGEIMAGKQESYTRGTEGTTGANKRIEVARELGERAFQRARSVNPGIANLAGAWNVYIDLALERLTFPFDPRLSPLPPIEGEFKFEAERGKALTQILEEEGETYWRPTYANYFTVYARNQQQLDRAKETFIRWARTGLGKSPSELFQKVNGFKEALTSAGQRAGPEMQAYAVEVKQELEAIVGIIEANLFDELFNTENLQKSWAFVAETPEAIPRMNRLIKTSRGVMAAVLFKLAKDPTLELLHSPHGSRGQLMGYGRNAIEMRSLQEQRLAILTAEVMGITLKEYHLDDPEKMLDINKYQENLDEIVKFKSDEYFKNLYDGFDLQEQEVLYRRLEEHPVIQKIKFARWADAKLKAGEKPLLTPRAEQIYNSVKSGSLIRYIRETEQNIKFARWADAKLKAGEDPELTPEQVDIYDAWKSGLMVRPIAVADLEAWERLDRVKKIQNYLEKGGDTAKLKGADRVLYEEASNAVNLAWEVFGAMGEKALRGGAAFVVDLKDDESNEFQDFIPDYWAKKLCHFAENWNKATYGGELDQQTQTKLRTQGWIHPNPQGLFAEELFYKVGQARRFAIWAMKAYGRDAKLWDFTLLRNGKPVDINTLGYTIYGENPDEDNVVDRYRYAAPINERFLGYNTQGRRIILIFDGNGKPMTLEFDLEDMSTGSIIPLEYDKNGNAVIWDKPDKTEVWSAEKQKLVDTTVIDRKQLTFDNLNINTRAEPMKIKMPKGPIDPVSGKMIVQGDPEQIIVDFDTIIHKLSSHPYSRWQGSPYPGYQEEWTGLLLSDASFGAARAIKAGELRPEDAPAHAVQLLIVDPTLERVGHFEIENLEPLVVLAAQEESYLSEWLIGDELYMNFLPEDASRVKNRTAFILQDHGGCFKNWIHMRAEAALWPDARARRLRTHISYISVDFSSLPQMYGAPAGPLDVFRMMAFAKYKMIGQFAMDKWINQIHEAQKVREASVEDSYNPQQEKMDESLGRKLNNEIDTNLTKFYDQIVMTKAFFPLSDKIRYPRTTKENDYQQYLVSTRDALGRVETFMHRNTVLQSLFRGERAPLYVAGLEIYKRQPNGSYELDRKRRHRILNPKIDTNRDSGSSRHRNNFFIYRYAKFARSAVYSALYPEVARYLAPLDNFLASFPRLAEEVAILGRLARSVTGWDWINSKANN